jgi:hypothetical protein
MLLRVRGNVVGSVKVLELNVNELKLKLEVARATKEAIKGKGKRG